MDDTRSEARLIKVMKSPAAEQESDICLLWTYL